MGILEGKRCLVTGAAHGIGAAITNRFLSENATVYAVDLDTRGLNKFSSGSTIETFTMDITDGASIESLKQKISYIDVLVNAVGYVASGTILEDGLSDLDRCYELNVRSMVRMITAFLPEMRARQSGSIINIASVVSSTKAAPNRFAYATSKSAVLGMTKAIAIDYISDGIRCNSISPGTIDTPSLNQRLKHFDNPEKAKNEFISRQPMGRLGDASEIATVAMMLASGEVDFMTGEDIIIDGGMSL